MARGFNRDHDHYVLKNRMLAAAEERGNKERQGDTKTAGTRPRDKSCFTCKLKKTCTQFRAKRSGGASGVVSFGGADEAWACERYEPAPQQNRGMNNKQIKSLMKSFKRAL
ncbi:MAG: hypothetical protein GF331_02205 [Chitinivibrionales bacterium]|nr:hypothetical protein [Chitinivibrionales bacterium]